MGDDAALDVRARQMQELAREGRYPSGSYLPALARGFASFEREDFSGTIEALAPLASQKRTRPIGCRKRRAWLDVRRPGASGVPVKGIAAVH